MPAWDNLEEYSDAAEYDAENSGSGPDGAFYEGLAREVGGPVLELACGTGRVAIPLAQQGFDVTGLDIVPAMLEAARQKSVGLPVTWVQGDCSDFDLGRQFRLIFMTGHSFQAFLDNAAQEAMLRCVRRHLAPGGLFAFESRNPNLAHLLTNMAEEEWHTYTDPQGRPVRVSGYQEYDHVRQVQTWVTHRRRPGTAGEEVRTTRIGLRYTFPQEMEALLRHSGFAVVSRYGNWDKSPLSDDSPEMIYVCTLAL